MRNRIPSLSVAFLGCLVLPGGCFSATSSGGETGDSGFPGVDSGNGFDTGTQDSTTPPTPDSGVVEAAPDVMEAGPDVSVTGAFSTTPVDFGLVDCGSGTGDGGATVTKSYTFQNTGPLPITWSATVNSVFTIVGASSGTITPPNSGTLTVAVAVPASTMAGAVLMGTLTLTTDVPGYTTVLVPLTVTAQGATLTASTVGFGSSAVGAPVTMPISIQNTGNASVNVTLGAPSDNEFTLSYTGSPGAETVAAATSFVGSSTFTPASVGLKSGTVALTTSGAVCGTPVTSFDVNGTGALATVGVGPSPLAFNTVTCGTKAPSQAITLKNTNAVPLTYSTALGQGASSPYSLDVPSGSVPANGQAVINVSPAAISLSPNFTPGFYNDTLTITVQGQTPVVVPLQESAGGAILALSMPATTFTTTASLPFTITNTGNEAANLTVTAAGDYTAVLTVSTVAAANGGTAPGNVTYNVATGQYVGSLSVSAPNLCNPQPAVIGLNASVAIAQYDGTDTLDVTYCGSEGLSETSLTVTNIGNAPLFLNNPTSLNGDFTVATYTTTAIPPNGTGTIVIQAINEGSEGEDDFPDTLSFGTNELGSPVHTVPVDDSYFCEGS